MAAVSQTSLIALSLQFDLSQEMTDQLVQTDFRDSAMKKEIHNRSSIFQTLKLSLKIAVMVEAAVFIGSYILWRKMNRDRDFRFTMHQKAPYILQGYYLVGETLGDQTTRHTDYSAWGIQQ